MRFPSAPVSCARTIATREKPIKERPTTPGKREEKRRNGKGQAKDKGTAEVVARLTAGDRAFVHSERYAEERAETAESQHPRVIVVSCSDSRVSAPIIFDAQKLGFMFESKTGGGSDHVVERH